MEFKPLIAENLGQIPTAIYSGGAFGLKELLCTEA